MAGSYPDAPSRRMAFDDDGTIGFAENDTLNGNLLWGTDGRIYEWNSTSLAEMNDEDNTQITQYDLGDNSSYSWVGFFFPELREVDGFFASSEESMNLGTLNAQTSGDTTNGRDGVWTTQITDYTAYRNPYPTNYRNGVQSTAVSNVRALRLRMFAPGGGGRSYIQGIHVYGEITPGETPDRLLFIDTATSLEFNLPVDYGDTPRGSATDTTIKLRNNSTSLSAGTVQITGESLYLSSGNWYTFSEGGAYQSTLQLASSIGSAADSPTITIRRIIPDSETVGLHAGRVQVSVGAWT